MAERPKTSAETRTPSFFSRADAYWTNCGITQAIGVARLAREDGALDVAVGREADVVELDLVEAGAGGDLCDRDVVVPDPTVVRIRPAEPGRVRPDRAVRAPDRQVRPSVRESRVLEDDDAGRSGRARTCGPAERPAAACSTASRHRPAWRAAPRTGRSRARRSRPSRRARSCSGPTSGAHVLLELARDRGERDRHVHPAHLGGRRSARHGRDRGRSRGPWASSSSSTPRPWASRRARAVVQLGAAGDDRCTTPARSDQDRAAAPLAAARLVRVARGNREFGSSGSKSIDTGAGTLVPVAGNRNSVPSAHGSLRPDDQAPHRGGTDRHRPVRRRV